MSLPANAVLYPLDEPLDDRFDVVSNEATEVPGRRQHDGFSGHLDDDGHSDAMALDEVP